MPRTNKRTLLGQAGLVGKIELNSSMTEKDVRREICDVFAAPMGLLERVKDEQSTLPPFSFSFLQKTGSGAKSLCLPAVKEDYEWSGQKVASLSKSGGFIYLLANERLPGWIKTVSFFLNLFCFRFTKSLFFGWN